jgi:hypothetical protein
MTHRVRQALLVRKARGGLVAASIALTVLIACINESPLASPSTSGFQSMPTPTNSSPSVPPTFEDVVVVSTPIPDTPGMGTGRRITVEDGYIADEEWVSPFNTDHPAVGNLNPDLLAAVQSQTRTIVLALIGTLVSLTALTFAFSELRLGP